jgi:hypothetical protein
LSRQPCIFRQTDLTRALKGTRAAGIEIDHIAIDKNGRIMVFPREPSVALREGKADANEWDDVT